MMEHIRTPKVENVRLIDRTAPRKATLGTLYLSATHTIFVENNPETRRETWVLHSMVASVERPPTTPSGSHLVVRTKNFQVVQLLIPQERDAMDVQASLARLSRPEKYSELYCLSINPNANKEEREESWSFLDLQADYRRMGVPNNLWVSTPANSEYRVCDTYPSELFVPKSATPPVIVGSSKFRSRGRLPVLTYFHQDTLAAICRCSQPLSGFSARSQEDEQMLQAIMKSNPGSDYIYVVDTRPKLNAMANRAAGKGYENEDHYTNVKLQFIGIENIHVMRNSQQKIIDVGELKTPSMGDFLWGLESSGWLKHIKAVLDTGVFIAKAVAEEGISVVVHCSDGWDRTAQACSVASVLLDPYYRTMKGLMLLIERDWVSFGHKFSHRYNHLEGDPKEVSPVIDQFLESVWQLSEQFPCAFEFNERFLVQLHRHVYSCQYGNFLGNSQKERRDMGLRERTHSLWPQLWKDRAQYANPLYRADHTQTQGMLRPNTTPYCFKMWKGMYNRVEKSAPPRQTPVDLLTVVREETQQLEEELTNHQERIAALMKGDQTKGNTGQRKTNKVYEEECRPGGPPTGDGPVSSPPQDYCPSRRGPPGPAMTLPLGPPKGPDPDDLSSACSDMESGVADLSSRSSSGGDDSRDPDEAVYCAA
ncbi:myotubularin-related protein 7b isoform X1 [Coregonus clupeaformis]|uniref:myotubularin-related protein 7b isoform X1 n=1 Tax=Coregonus clupeaformis TaxID=59861 RepID=UPI001E1C6637|nr:myotubularin-related protein 7b isoform X1 [Coregonus clupeaformis]